MGSVGLQIGLLAVMATVVFAWVKGGPGEREAAIAVAVAWIGSLAVQSFERSLGLVITLLVFDFLLALALLIIAIRQASPWVGVTMMIQAFAMAVHAQFLVETDHGTFRTYVIVLNLASYSLLLSIAAGTTVSWIRRARATRSAQSAPPPGLRRAA